MIVKICGLQQEEHVKTAVEAGADFLGFIFAKSKRQLTIEQAIPLLQTVPSHVKKVGVFVNPSLDEAQDAIRQLGLDFIQLHGDESPEFCQSMPVPVIKAFSIRSKEDVRRLDDYDVAYTLVDAPGGGSGRTFDWELLNGIKKERLLLAGGLTPKNVAEAIRTVSPAGVDVASGVETNGGKDHEKIRTFIKQVKDEER